MNSWIIITQQLKVRRWCEGPNWKLYKMEELHVTILKYEVLAHAKSPALPWENSKLDRNLGRVALMMVVNNNNNNNKMS